MVAILVGLGGNGPVMLLTHFYGARVRLRSLGVSLIDTWDFSPYRLKTCEMAAIATN